MPLFASAVADAANAELARFGGMNETDASAAPLLREYWMTGAGLKDAAARAAIVERTAWSAASISFVVLRTLSGAGSTATFPRSAGHWQYVGAAIRNDFSQAPRPAFYGFPPFGDGSEPVQVGDIVGTPRTTALDDYADALKAAFRKKTDDQAYPSHFDIVVAIEGSVASLVGGNVSNTVKRTKLDLQPDGRLPDRPFKFDKAMNIIQAPFIALVRHMD